MINKVVLVGNLGNDPEVKHTPSGMAVTNFSIATTERWKDKNSGEMQEKTEWHRIVAWGKTAEVAGRCLAKGRQVCVEGKIQTRKWQDKDGKDQYTTEVVAQSITFLDSKNRDSQAPPAESGQEDGLPF